MTIDRFGDYRVGYLRADWTLVGGNAYTPLPTEIPLRPPNLDQMLSWASVLAEDLDFLRVDLYDLGDRVLVGELTPYPNRGTETFRPRELDNWLGQMWKASPAR